MNGHSVPRFTLKQLSYLLAVSRAGGVKQAARGLNVAPSSVSEAIAQLEHAFGLQLFVRKHAQGVAPTTDGTRLIAAARRLLGEAHEFEEQAARLGQTLSGTLQLGCFKTIAPIIMPGLMRRFADLNPGVQVALTVGDQTDLLQGLRAGELDLALTYQVDLGPEIAFQPLLTLPPYILLGPALAAQYPQPALHLADMAAHDLIFLDLPITRDYYLSLFRAASVQPRIAHRTTALSMVKALAANGFGYGLVNERSVNDRAVDGKLLAIRHLLGNLPPLTLGVARVGGVRATRKSSAFLEICLADLTTPAATGDRVTRFRRTRRTAD